MRTPEILAPAGSMESLTAALRSGADAVYIGGKRFSARNGAANFSDEELAEAAALCHKYGAKLFIAVNTIISDDEAEDFCRYIKYTAEIGADAYIVQDWGCAALIKSCVPDAVLHASTQMSVHTVSGAELLRDLGYARVVPARELDKDTIAGICRLGLETEIFVHGALCMSVSGQCYMSAIMGSRSANRGCCGQACRLPFSAAGNKNAAALSLKDLSLIPKARELAEIGVDSLKIEGRMKRPEYVASAVNELKNALSGRAPDMAVLRGVFSRGGFTDGYYTNVRRDMFGVREKDDVIAAKEILPKLHELYRFERKTAPVDFHAVIKANKPVKITAESGNLSVSAEGSVPEKALNRPTDEAVLTKQLSKLGDTIFTLGKINAEIDGGLIVPAGELNRLRREVTERLTELIIQKNTPHFTITDFVPDTGTFSASETATAPLPRRVFCRTAEQAETAAEFAQFVILPENIISQQLIEKCGADKIIISPPRFISNEEKTIKRLSELKELGISRLFCHTPDCIAIGRKLGFRLHGSFTLNIYNSYSASYMKQLGLEDFTVSFEAKLTQIAKMRREIPLGAVTYGRLPLMLTRNCPIKNEVGCARCSGSITDRTGRKFPIVCAKEYVEILNPNTLLITDKEMCGADFSLIMLNKETPQQVRDALSGKRPDGDVTHGLYYRGI